MRKRRLFGLFFGLILTIPLVAQQSELGIRFGFQASPTLSWMLASTRGINKTGTNFGVRLGILSEYYFTENYAFVSGLGFSFNQGGTLVYESGGTYWPDSDKFPAPDTLPAGVRLGYNLQYFEIPIGLKMRTREFGYLRYYLEPNFIIGFRTNARGSIEGMGIPDGTEQIDIRNEVNFFNMSVGIGGGIEYAISGTSSFIVGINLHFGFVDITQNANQVVDPGDGGTFRPDNSKAVSNGAAIKLGFIF